MKLASAALLRKVEAMGVRATEAHWKLVPPDLAKRSRVAHVGDGLLTVLEGSDSLRMNRVIGLGHRGRASETMIDEIVGRYRASKIQRFSLLLSPGPQAATLTRWLLRRRFTRKRGITLLVRECRKPVPRLSSKVRVVRAARGNHAAVVRIHEECFGMPASQRSWGLAAAAAPGNEHLLAYVGKTPVAVGTLRIDGDLAWLGGGATRPRWRRLGAHGALIVARLRRAARRGCRWSWVETMTPVRGRPDGSRRNMIRLGFEEVCVKPTFVWHAR